MKTKIERLQSLIQLYEDETGLHVVDMDLVADWAIKRGVVAPTPKTAKELLSEQFAQAAREEHLRDPATGLSYRRRHALRGKDKDGRQRTFWVELERATRPQMLTTLVNRRQQMVGDAVQLKIDELVWNSRNPNEQPIQLVMDFTHDVEERLNAPGLDGEAAA